MGATFIDHGYRLAKNIRKVSEEWKKREIEVIAKNQARRSCGQKNPEISIEKKGPVDSRARKQTGSTSGMKKRASVPFLLVGFFSQPWTIFLKPTIRSQRDRLFH
jgi:hypothetical protein